MSRRFKSRSVAASALLAAALLAAPSRAQQAYQVIEGTSLGGNFGTSLARLGDIDGDGYDDLAVGAPFDDTKGLDAGLVRIVSGHDGSTIRTIYGSYGEHFGHCLANITGILFAAGAPYASPNGTSSGLLRVVDASNGSTYATMNGASAGDRFGWSVAVLAPPFLTGEMLAIGAPYSNLGGSDAGAVYFKTPAGGGPGFSPSVITGDQASGHFGWSIAVERIPNGSPLLAAQDRVLIGSPDHDGGGTNGGKVDAWLVVRPIGSDPPSISYIAPRYGLAGEHYGTAVARIDIDGAHFAVGAPDAQSGKGRVYIVNVTTTQIASGGTIVNPHPTGAFGTAISSMGDWNGNGHEDYAIGLPDYESGGDVVGMVIVYDGFTLTPMVSILGTVPDGRMGSAIAGNCDFDGDSKADIAIGTPGYDGTALDAGLIFLGKGSGALFQGTFVSGTDIGDATGRSVAGIGDVNADGVPDWIVGSPTDASVIFLPNPVINEQLGSVRVVSGATSATLFANYGSAYGDELGWSVAGVGDTNLDGIPDYVVGAPQRNVATPDTGYARLFSGKNGGMLFTFNGTVVDGEFGYSVGGGSDLSGDGRPDVIVSAPGTTNGNVYTFSGASSLLIGTLTGQTSGDRFGHAVANLAADLSGDGKPDFVVGAPGNDLGGSGAGRAYVMRSHTSFLTKYTFTGATGDGLGTSVARAGDVNRDGVVDIVAGAPTHDALPIGANAGLARSWSGADGSVLWTSTTTSPSALLGSSVAGIGDVDLDGYDDVAIGAPQGPLAFGTTGFVRIVSGKTGAIALTALGFNNGEGLGSSVASVGDLDADGLPDLLAGAPSDDSHGTNSGKARSFSMRALGVGFYGTVPPGCAGEELLSTFGEPTVGNAAFQYRANHAPPSSLGLLLVANVKELSPTGDDWLGIGAPFLVDVFHSTLLLGLDMNSDALGFGATPGAIPNDPSLVGAKIYAQVVWVWPIAACSLPPLNISVSSGLSITLH